MDDTRFEWDYQKEIINIRKHGIDFQTASLVFRDPNRIEFYDEAHSEEEERYNTIGMAHNVLFVVYTERRDFVRIISARVATNFERGLYFADHL